MGGIKHNMYQYGIPGQASGVAKNSGIHFMYNAGEFERQIAAAATNRQPYCKICGQFIYATNTDENGRASNAEWELMNNVHFKCASAAEAKAKEEMKKQIEEMQAKAAEEEAKRKEAEKDFDWDGYMEKMMKRDEE
jgi:hypothetical protein